MKKITQMFLFCCLLFEVGYAQSSSPLEQYIQEALNTNIALQQEELSYQKSLAALKEAKGNFFPSFGIQARYSVARGGRAFVIPIGDLMNPVYQNLNVINDLGESATPDYPTIPDYPQIENEQVNFLRETEQETMVRMRMPIFNSAILYNHRIQQNLAQAEKVSVEVYRKELRKEVKTAYFNFAKAKKATELLDETQKLVEENLRTTESLHRNNKVTIDQVYSAKAEVKAVEQQRATAQKNLKVAQSYFNFLLNRDYETEITLMKEQQLPQSVVSLEQARANAFQQRDEFEQLNYFIAATDQKVKLSKGNFLPNLGLAVDYGIQGTDYNITSESDFVMGSVVLNWNVMDWTTKAKTQQAQIEKEELFKQKAATKQQIGLQVVQAFYELEAAAQQIDLAKAGVASAQKAFQLVQKKYNQGQANLVEWTNARTQMTTAEQRQNIAIYDYQIRLAEFERAIGQ